jgi:hypothetical protein
VVSNDSFMVKNCGFMVNKCGFMVKKCGFKIKKQYLYSSTMKKHLGTENGLFGK